MVRLASVFAVALFALTGCGASQKATTTAVTPCDYSTPPGEMQMTYEGKTDAANAPKGDVATSYRPNAQERPTKGAVHAAVN